MSGETIECGGCGERIPISNIKCSFCGTEVENTKQLELTQEEMLSRMKEIEVKHDDVDDISMADFKWLTGGTPGENFTIMGNGGCGNRVLAKLLLQLYRQKDVAVLKMYATNLSHDEIRDGIPQTLTTKEQLIFNDLLEIMATKGKDFPYKFQPIGFTDGGVGASKCPIIAKIIAQNYLRNNKPHFIQSEAVFSINNIGGGTGSGTTPVITKYLSENRTSDINSQYFSFSIFPFRHMTRSPSYCARYGFTEINKAADMVIAIENDYLMKNLGIQDLGRNFGPINDCINKVIDLFLSIRLRGVSEGFVNYEEILDPLYQVDIYESHNVKWVVPFLLPSPYKEPVIYRISSETKPLGDYFKEALEIGGLCEIDKEEFKSIQKVIVIVEAPSEYIHGNGNINKGTEILASLIDENFEDVDISVFTANPPIQKGRPDKVQNTLRLGIFLYPLNFRSMNDYYSLPQKTLDGISKKWLKQLERRFDDPSIYKDELFSAVESPAELREMINAVNSLKK
jgi:hypothetical protein